MASSSTNAGCVGVLLAGGLSRRMGGGDKSLRHLGGRPMIAHAVERLRPQVDALILNANGDASRFAFLGLPVVADREADYAGPLAGVLAGMDWAREHAPDARWIVTAACDTPFFPRDLVARLRAAAEEAKAEIALAASKGQGHFVFALWPVALADDLADYLAQGGRKVQDWIAQYAHLHVEFAPAEIGGSEVDPFFNVNTPEDLVFAESLLAKGQPMNPPVFGIVGWKNSGKTTLTARLIGELSGRGFKVAAVKHAHHGFDVDQPGRDSYKFREAGAREVAVVSAKRVAIMHELRDEEEPPLEEVLRRLKGSHLILIEGFKREPHPKIEVRRQEAVQHDPMAGDLPGIVAIASDHQTETGALPVFELDDIEGMADFILRHTGLLTGP
jgi:molybdenum cofactor guanylyltransferase/molybdopterin-guanine dinucleotide biosynthesis protein MobB